MPHYLQALAESIWILFGAFGWFIVVLVTMFGVLIAVMWILIPIIARRLPS